MRYKIAGLAAAAIMFGGVQTASAADMAVKARPVAPPIAMYNWTGIYIGVSGGWAHQDFDWAFNPAIPAAPNQSFSLSRNSGVLDMHAGLQYQFDQWLLGVEFAYNWLGNDYATHAGYGVDPTLNPGARVRNLWTVGPRVGWIPMSMPNTLLYVTGGYARGHVDTVAITVATGAINPVFNTSANQNGWFVGGGIEYMLMQNVILGIEYQHIDLGSTLHCLATTCGFASTNNHDVDAQVDKITARLSVKLNPIP